MTNWALRIFLEKCLALPTVGININNLGRPEPHKYRLPALPLLLLLSNQLLKKDPLPDCSVEPTTNAVPLTEQLNSSVNGSRHRFKASYIEESL